MRTHTEKKKDKRVMSSRSLDYERSDLLLCNNHCSLGNPGSSAYLKSPHGDSLELAVEDVELAHGVEVEGQRRDLLDGDVLQGEDPVDARAFKGLARYFKILDLEG